MSLGRVRIYNPAYNQVCNVGMVGQAYRDAAQLLRAGYDMEPRDQASCDLISMRNSALHSALEDGCDYLYMQDSDVICLSDRGAILPLIETAQQTGAAMVGAAVMMRTRPPRINTWPVGLGVFEVEKIGTGIVLIDLAKIREWYGAYDGPCFNRSYEKPDGKNRMVTAEVGSDIWFCKVIRGHGQTVYCNADLDVRHVDATYYLGHDGRGNIYDSHTDSAVNTEEGDAAPQPQMATGA